MHLFFTNTLPLLSCFFALATAQNSTNSSSCSIFEPTSAYQIFSSLPDLSLDLTIGNSTNSTNSTSLSSRSNERNNPKTRRSANIPFTFHVSQGADNTDKQDLVVAFAGLPCFGPGPFSFEFNFQPQTAYIAKGQGQIDMFRVDTQDLEEDPTWATIEPVTGSLVGTFDLPATGSDEPVLLYLNQLVCQDELVLRFGITLYSIEEGSVAYINSGGMGLRERNGCWSD